MGRQVVVDAARPEVTVADLVIDAAGPPATVVLVTHHGTVILGPRL